MEQLRTVTRDRKSEKLVAGLYAAVMRLGTETSQGVLIEQLFRETTELWRMANAIQGIWSPKLHAQILATLRTHPQGILGANRYCDTVIAHLKKTAPLHDLGALALTLKPATEGDRRRLAYVLWQAARAALSDRRLDSARVLVDAAQALKVKELSDYHVVYMKHAPPSHADVAQEVAKLRLAKATGPRARGYRK